MTKRSAQPAGKAVSEADKVSESLKVAEELRFRLSPEDAHNLIALLNRVQTTGISEAMCLGVLGQKLQYLKANYEAPNGKDANPAV